MTVRALLAIGCDAYEHQTPLTGAENDARAIFDALIRPEVGDYDADRSRLLLSPTLQEVRDALSAMLFDGETPDTITISFAGHGAVSGGSFYMAVRESRSDAFSVTALSLADLFRMIAEAKPAQTYIFIDACQSGGLIGDLNVVLKSEVMGELGTPGITLLATAASNEFALEIGGHGIGTAALLECVNGKTFLQDSGPALDLVEIGRAISAQVSAAGGQTPVVWGLNLYGPPSFCKNPHASTGNTPLRSVLAGWPDADTSAAIRNGLPKLWEPYVAIPTQWNPRDFVDRLSPILSELADNPLVQLNFMRRIADACAARAADSRDRFREIEVRSACACALLPYSAKAEIAAYLSDVCSEIGALAEAACRDVVAGIDNYEYAIVTGGMSDLYYLPIRLTNLLGWAGFCAHARMRRGKDAAPALAALIDLYDRIFKTYSLALVSMSDCQAPATLLALTATAQLGLAEQGERLIGHLFASCVECGGRVARGDLEPEKVLAYLVARQLQSFKDKLVLVAQPTELATVLLRSSRLFDLSDEFDLALESFDHLSLVAYLPEGYSGFADDLIQGGTNAIFRTGHDYWTISEMENAWPDFPSPENLGMGLSTMLACLLFPDRVPWFLAPVPNLIENSAQDPRNRGCCVRLGVALQARALGAKRPEPRCVSAIR